MMDTDKLFNNLSDNVFAVIAYWGANPKGGMKLYVKDAPPLTREDAIKEYLKWKSSPKATMMEPHVVVLARENFPDGWLAKYGY